MIEEQAIVRNTDGGSLRLEVIPSGPCDACSLREACFRSNGELDIAMSQVAVRGRPALHERVTVRIPQASVLSLTSLVYGVPLLGLLAGLILGQTLLFTTLVESARALASFGLGLGLTALGGLVTLHVDRRLSRRVLFEVIRKAPIASDSSDPSE